LVIPLFLVMGKVASGAGLSARLFRGANALLGHHKGRHGHGGAASRAPPSADLRFLAGDGRHHGAGGAAADAQIRGYAGRSRRARWPPAVRSAFRCHPRSRWYPRPDRGRGRAHSSAGRAQRFVIQTIAGDVSMLDTFNGVVPLLIAEFFRVSLIIAVPILTLLLIR
jgi:hypothetical protein